MLVVDGHTLRAVDLLHLINKVQLHRTLTEHPKHLLGINRTDHQLLTDGNVLSVFNEQTGTLGNLVRDLFGTIVGDDDDLAGALCIFDANATGDLADRSHTLGGASLEEFHNAGQTMRDVFTSHTAGVEGTHRQLGSGLTDRLSSDDADCFTNIDQLASCHRTAVAHGARSDIALTRENSAHAHPVSTRSDHLFHARHGEFFASSCNNLAVDLNIAGKNP